ncbi:hypothetical protein DRQ25_16805, partial [Candidatus Fermentibacteria bacterium]
DVDFQIDSVITETNWESVGPTGSSADNIWTSMDSVPSGTNWVELKIDGLATGTDVADVNSLMVYARKTGSTEGTGHVNRVFYASDGRNADDYDAYVAGLSTFKVAVDSSLRFDLAWGCNLSSTTIWLTLVGYGTNY